MKSKLPSKQLLGSSEIELHYKRPLFDTMISISNAKEADQVLRSFINLKQLDLKEHFWVMTLTTANRLIGITQSTIGTSMGVMVNTKEIIQLALTSNATNLIVAHSHPSGNLYISSSDREQTLKLKSACSLMDIVLLDHLILSTESFLSFAEESEI